MPLQPELSTDCGLIERILRLLGRAWSGAVLQALIEGNSRYSEIARAVPGVTDSVLTTRLRELTEHGLVERLVEAGPPVVVRYELTAAGRDIAPVLGALEDYARAHPEVLPAT